MIAQDAGSTVCTCRNVRYELAFENEDRSSEKIVLGHKATMVVI
jgi:hypothetical protein